MAYHNGMQFSTKDRDNDKNTNSNCALSYTGGGWWYKNCLTGGHSNSNAYWLNGVGTAAYFSNVEMKLRPKICKSETTSCTAMTPPTKPPVVTPCGFGWTRIAYLNMTDPAQSCPILWTRFTSGNKRVCFRSQSSGGSSIYNQVCGRIIGYQYGNPHGFYPYHSQGCSIDSYYIDGISVTHGRSPRQHIWTFAAGYSEGDLYGSCPCGSPTRQDTIPPYIGNNYFCETGIIPNPHGNVFYSNDSLWDGGGCGPGHSCECELNSPPWFTAQLNTSTTDDIEVRSCSYQTTIGKNVGIELIELYIK